MNFILKMLGKIDIFPGLKGSLIGLFTAAIIFYNELAEISSLPSVDVPDGTIASGALLGAVLLTIGLKWLRGQGKSKERS